MEGQPLAQQPISEWLARRNAVIARQARGTRPGQGDLPIPPFDPYAPVVPSKGAQKYILDPLAWYQRNVLEPTAAALTVVETPTVGGLLGGPSTPSNSLVSLILGSDTERTSRSGLA